MKRIALGLVLLSCSASAAGLVAPPGREKAIQGLVEGIGFSPFALRSIAIERSVIRYSLSLESDPEEIASMTLQPRQNLPNADSSQSFAIVLEAKREDPALQKLLARMAAQVKLRDRGGFFIELAERPAGAGATVEVSWRKEWLRRLQAQSQLRPDEVRLVWRVKVSIVALVAVLAALVLFRPERPNRS